MAFSGSKACNYIDIFHREITMPYRKIKFQQGSYYHIFNRNAGGQSIFYNHRDYLTLIPLMRDIAIECAVTIIAYCLLPNHYHWLVRQDGKMPAGKLPTRAFWQL